MPTQNVWFAVYFGIMSLIPADASPAFVYGALHTPTFNVNVSEAVYVRCLRPYVRAPDGWQALHTFPGAAAFFNKWPWAALPDALP